MISLTSVPPRFGGLVAVLESLATQGADEIQLWLPQTYDRFPDWDGTLPAIPEGVALRRCPEDLGPATKLLPALEGLAPADRLIICDDDAHYGPGWAAALAEAAGADMAAAASTYPVARLALTPRPAPRHRIVQGFAGVLLAPAMIRARKIALRDRMVDDIWLSAQLAASGTEIAEAPAARARVTPTPTADTASLQDAAPGGVTRAQANLLSARALRAELGIWP